MSRKTASFSQLINYLNQGRVAGDEYFFSHNIYSHTPHYMAKEYSENYKNLKKRVNSNALYHEIISLKHQKNISIEKQREILKELMNQYTNTRANNNMVYGVIHEQHNQVHSHLMISSNELASDSNKRLSKKEFTEIKGELKKYAKAKYPELEITEETRKKSRAKTRAIDNEVQFKKRTGKKSDREQMKERLQAVFARSNKPQDFIKILEADKIQVYQRGKTFGFLDEATGKKYRLKTLELEKEFSAMNSKFVGLAQEAKQNEGFKTSKEVFTDKLKEILSTSQTYNEFMENLGKENIHIYRTDKGFGFVDKKTDWKYRLETLKLETEFQSFEDRVNSKNKKYKEEEEVKKPENEKLKKFANKAKNFGKRFLHEVVNDLEHFITGRKPTMENEIWTQENAGQMRKNASTGFDKANFAKVKSDEQEKFKEQIQQARKAQSQSSTKSQTKE
jgi:hypothetical protein